jgi:hypothetical protein
MARPFDPWEGHSLADRNYEQPQVSDKQFAPAPRRLGEPEPPKPAFKPHPRRSQDMQVDLISEQADKERFWDYLEGVITGSQPGTGLPGDQFRGSDGRLQIRVYHGNDLHLPERQRRAWIIVADSWNQVLAQLDAIAEVERQEREGHT